MLSEEEKKEIEQAISIILRGIDIESSALILEKAIMDNYIISRGRINILKIATRQILNYIEEHKNKGYLDVIREKVKANEEITKLQKENEELKEENIGLFDDLKNWKKLNNEKNNFENIAAICISHKAYKKIVKMLKELENGTKL